MTFITGRGILTWDGAERRSDRYGSIVLDQTNSDGTARTTVSMDYAALLQLTGRTVSISAKVLEARTSGHIGDIFRGIYPTTPDVGQAFSLGIGEFFLTPTGGGAGKPTNAFGIKPKDGRPNDWFAPETLYRLHDQTVEITIETVQ